MATTAATVGINVDGIKQISSAIDSYKSDVQSKIDVSVADALIQNAIKGTGSEAAFRAAANELNAAIEELIVFVDRYKNVLTEIEASYKKHDAGVNMTFKSNE